MRQTYGIDDAIVAVSDEYLTGVVLGDQWPQASSWLNGNCQDDAYDDCWRYKLRPEISYLNFTAVQRKPVRKIPSESKVHTTSQLPVPGRLTEYHLDQVGSVDMNSVA